MNAPDQYKGCVFENDGVLVFVKKGTEKEKEGSLVAEFESSDLAEAFCEAWNHPEGHLTPFQELVYPTLDCGKPTLETVNVLLAELCSVRLEEFSDQSNGEINYAVVELPQLDARHVSYPEVEEQLSDGKTQKESSATYHPGWVSVAKLLEQGFRDKLKLLDRLMESLGDADRDIKIILAHVRNQIVTKKSAEG